MKLSPIILAFLFFQLCTEVKAQWSVKYLDETGYATWSNILKFKNDSLGLFMGNNSAILKSVDAGETWEKIIIDKIFGIRDFQFVGDSVVFAVGDVHNGSQLIKSLDKGNTWDSIARFPGGQINSIWFFNKDSALAFGAGGIFRTSNAGNHWELVWDDSQLVYRYGALSNSFFATSQVGYASGFGQTQNLWIYYLLKTTDSGVNWDTICTSKHFIKSLCFINADTGFIATESPNIMKTNDGGHTWSEKVITDSRSTVSSIHFISEKVGFATGGKMNELTGGGGGGLDFSSSFFVSKTIDGGETWETFNSSGIPLNSIYFINDTTGFVSGQNSLIMKSNGIINELPTDYPWHLVDDGSAVNDLADSNSLVKVFPNPTVGMLTIQLKNPDQPVVNLRLFGISGQTIDIGNPKLNSENISIDLSGLGSGVYLIELTFSNKRELIKVLKK
ncbi:MAG TPA: YCF48-related protein [Prolixibacteraceae bacterium]